MARRFSIANIANIAKIANIDLGYNSRPHAGGSARFEILMLAILAILALLAILAILAMDLCHS
jgi:hypothetical protein